MYYIKTPTCLYSFAHSISFSVNNDGKVEKKSFPTSTNVMKFISCIRWPTKTRKKFLLYLCFYLSILLPSTCTAMHITQREISIYVVYNSVKNTFDIFATQKLFSISFLLFSILSSHTLSCLAFNSFLFICCEEIILFFYFTLYMFECVQFDKYIVIGKKK